MNKEKPLITMKSCDSSNVAAHGYCEKTKTLAIQYKNGQDVYHYPNFEAKKYAELEKAKSVGGYVSKEIRGLKFEKQKKKK